MLEETVGIVKQDIANWWLLLLIAGAVMLGSCSTQDVVNIALSKDPEHAVEHMARARAESYKRDPRRLIEDAKRVRRQFNQLVSFLRGEVSDTWGEDEVVVPDDKRYVKYTQAYRSRAIVNFDSGEITVETVDQENPLKNLEQAIITTLLTPEDPRAVDLYSDKQIRLSGRPYLQGLVRDHNGRPIERPAAAEAYARYLIGAAVKLRKTAENTTVRYVHMKMVRDHIHRQASRYLPYVSRHARRFGVSKSLVFAVIKVESAFNPFAVSSAPAYGLMQLVPTSGGRDAYTEVKGRDGIPSREYLFDSNNNIELGTAYLYLIDTRYLRDIRNPVSREYCTIAAYNGGAGNVFRAFARDPEQAIETINRMSPAAVYKRLRERHARTETRRYLGKVVNARKEFVNL